ncbi:MAG: CRTAC1 family protein [Phycisphaerae bacterium]
MRPKTRKAQVHRIVTAAIVIGLTSTTYASVVFTDVTAAANLDVNHWPAACDPCGDEMVRMSAGAAPGDYNGDGWIDLYVTRHDAPNLLFENQGNGTFTEVAAAAGVDLNDRSAGAAFADVDNDGDVDLYVITVRNEARFYINNGDGTFTNEYATRGIAIPESDNESSIAFGDYDLDGWLDAHVTDWFPGQAPFGLFHNNGDGTFTDVSQAADADMTDLNARGFASAFADINNDNQPDLLVAADFGTSQLLTNDGDGTFTNVTAIAGVGTDENGMGSTLGDIDNDGDLDWFVTSIFDADETCEKTVCNWGYTGNRLYINDGNGVFTDGTDFAEVRDGGWGWGAAFFDFDNDGDLDLGMTNGVNFPQTPAEDQYLTDQVKLWENEGNGIMDDVSNLRGFTDTGSGKAFVVFDYDRDGDLDVFITNNAGMPVLYRNDGGNDNAWLRINLRGDETNYFGVGATIRVQVTEGGPTQMRLVNCNANYQSHDEITAHFGLGNGVTNIHEVTVEWPVSGKTLVFNNVTANQTMTIAEAGNPVPAVNTWGMLILLLSTITVATATLRRYRFS